MKIVIYVGKFEKQFSKVEGHKPKALLEIGGMPILWHIMKHYASFGHNDFILACSYNAFAVKEFFCNYAMHAYDLNIDLKNNTITPINAQNLNWNITIIDVGQNTNTGGALKKVQHLIGNERFMFTYGDGLSNIDINALESHHIRHNKTVTISSISASQKFGIIDFNDNGSVIGFREKDSIDSTVNGGFMVCNPNVFEFIDENPSTIFEREPMVTAVACKQVTAYRHNGFWRSVDSFDDLEELNAMWANNKAPWKIWE